ncbi:MAG: hypothetical protein AB8B91_20275 [Rubripirellula sp.]
MAVQKRVGVFIGGLVCGIACTFTVVSTAEPAPRRTATWPTIDPSVASGCQAQLAALEAAESALEAAEQAALDAYAAWEDCQENTMRPDITADPGTLSILTK